MTEELREWYLSRGYTLEFDGEVWTATLSQLTREEAKLRSEVEALLAEHGWWTCSMGPRPEPEEPAPKKKSGGLEWL